MHNATKLRDQSGEKSDQIHFKKLTFEEQVLGNRAMAHRLGWHLIRRWGLDLPRDEATSLIDFALCEALVRFDPTKGAELSTYLYYVLKGELKRVRRNGVKEVRNIPLLEEPQVGEGGERTLSEMLPCPNPSPEVQTHTKTLRSLCRKLMSDLSDVQRQVVMETIAGEENVASVARKMGYSRGHLSTLKNAALRRMRRGVRQEASDLLWSGSGGEEMKVAA